MTARGRGQGVDLMPGCSRIPDGHIVPNPPRTEPEPEYAPEPETPVTFAERGWAAVYVGIVVAAIAIGRILR